MAFNSSFRSTVQRFRLGAMLAVTPSTDRSWRSSPTVHFQPQNRPAFAFKMRMEAIANPTDSCARVHDFGARFLCWSFACCILRKHRGLAGRNCTEGSNPDLSAIQSGLQRNSPILLLKAPEMAAIPRFTPSNRTRESGLPRVVGKLWSLFL
jgi:hypothetical protein